MGFGFETGFNTMQIIGRIFFIAIISIVAYAALSGIRKWVKNNNSPRLTERARLVTKRADVSGTREFGASTIYYAGFEFENGDRLELSISGEEYGPLAEGDEGELSWQGTRYIKFDRYKEA